MASDNAKQVAREVIKTIRKHQIIDKGDIIKKVGYSDSVSKRPSTVTETQSYKDEIEPIVNRWRREISRIQTALESKDLNAEEYKTLVDSIDKLNKQVQLAEGKPTETVKTMIDDEQFERIVNNYANKQRKESSSGKDI